MCAAVLQFIDGRCFGCSSYFPQMTVHDASFTVYGYIPILYSEFRRSFMTFSDSTTGP
jgi:hypothetical protein